MVVYRLNQKESRERAQCLTTGRGLPECLLGWRGVDYKTRMVIVLKKEKQRAVNKTHNPSNRKSYTTTGSNGSANERKEGKVYVNNTTQEES